MKFSDERLASKWVKHCRATWGEDGPEPFQAAQALLGEWARQCDKDEYVTPHHVLTHLTLTAQISAKNGNIERALMILRSLPHSPRLVFIEKIDPGLECLEIFGRFQDWITKTYADENIPPEFLAARIDEPG